MDHQLGLQGISWDDFISHDLFSTSQVLSEVEHEIGGTSHQYECHKTPTMPVFITYQRGSRHLFAAAKRVLSPPGVEGASLPTSTTQVQDKGKRPIHDEGPSGEQEADFILIQDDYADEESAKFRRMIQEQKMEIQDLSLNLERAKWIIRYLEQRNK